jgi:hypothetical protein
LMYDFDGAKMKNPATPFSGLPHRGLSDVLCVVRGDKTAVPYRRDCLSRRSP